MDAKIKFIYYDRLLVTIECNDISNITRYVVYMIRLINSFASIVDDTYNFLKKHNTNEAILKRFDISNKEIIYE